MSGVHGLGDVVRILLCAGVAGFVSTRVYTSIPALHDLDRIVFSYHLRSSSWDTGIVLVEVDDKTVEKLGRPPWTRGVWATAIRELSSWHPRIIGIDFVFDKPGQDEVYLTEAVRDAGNVVLVAAEVSIDGHTAWLEPYPDLHRRSFAVGHAGLISSQDAARRVSSMGLASARSETSGRIPPFPLLLASIFSGDPLIFDEDFGSYRLRDLALPANPLVEAAWVSWIPQMPIYFSGPIPKSQRVSLSDVVLDTFKGEFLSARLVVLGATYKGSGDEFTLAAPWNDDRLAGVEVIVNAINTILTRQLIHTLPRWSFAVLASIACVSSFILAYSLKWNSFLPLFMFLVMLVATPWILFEFTLIQVSVGPSLIASAIGIGMAAIRRGRPFRGRSVSIR